MESCGMRHIRGCGTLLIIWRFIKSSETSGIGQVPRRDAAAGWSGGLRQDRLPEQ
jgi:hypothetical protein